MDRFQALKVFTTVVDQGSFAAAARVLDVSPATVTEQVQALEAHLKTKLLNRTTRRMSLTAEGAAYHEHASQILARMEEADAMLTATRISPKGVLRVMVPPLLGTRVLLPALPAFVAQYPDLRVDVSLGARAPSFIAQNLDLGLQATAEIEPGLVFRPLGLVPVLNCASPEYLRRRGVPRTPDDLDTHDVIGARPAPGVVLSALRFERDRRIISREPRGRIIADSGDAQIALALAHGGIMQVAEYGVRELLDSGRLVRILKDWEWSGPPLGAVHLPNRFLQPRVGVFLEFAQKLIAPHVAPYREDWVRP